MKNRFELWVLTIVSTAMMLSCATTAPEPTRQPGPPPVVERNEAEPAKPLVNTVRWTTASEVESFGFDIYRSASEDGPFERVTSEPIPGAGTTDEPQSYVWVDDTIEPRKSYYYYVESISMSGVRQRFTPIAKTAPKVPPERD